MLNSSSLVVLIACIFVSFASPVLADAGASKSKLTELLREVEFSTILQDSETANAGTTHSDGVFFLKDAQYEDLSETEKKVFLIFITPGQVRLSLGKTIPHAISFAEQNGRLPDDGAELALESLGTSSSSAEKLAELIDGSTLELLERCRLGINPATGKLIKSFSESEWTPLGVNIQKLNGKDGIRQIPVPDSNGLVNLTAHQGWEVKVYGEQKDTILIKKIIWRPQLN